MNYEKIIKLQRVAYLFRDLQVTGAGWLVKRFWKSELENNMRECVEIIKEMIKNKNYIKKK